MGNKDDGSTSLSYILFPVKQKDGAICYYATDYSEELGSSVYKGYRCQLINEVADLKPRRVKKEELILEKEKPVAIKIYKENKHPSPYQFYASEIAVLKISGKDALIMDYIDGFHVFPDANQNPELKQLTFSQVADIAWQLIVGLNQYHYRNTSGASIVHGDVKGENIIIRLKEIIADKQQKLKIDVFYIDPDYAKPILMSPQNIQGTPEHLALEVLDGFYSEEGEFFALSPILLSLFGAHNPLSYILDYRNNHLYMNTADLARKFCDLGFCSEGLFEHFGKKPEELICRLVEQFIMQMGSKYKKDRPIPAAVLEFFTALRQYCIFTEVNENSDIFVLRLCIAAKNDSWLKDGTYINQFTTLCENVQDRLVSLMSIEQSTRLYKILSQNKDCQTLLVKLRKKISEHLAEKSHAMVPPSSLSSLFFSPITVKELDWFLECFRHNDTSGYYSPAHVKTRNKLTGCKDKTIAPLISIVAEGLYRPSDELAYQP